jgi:acyl dehydratase
MDQPRQRAARGLGAGDSFTITRCFSDAEIDAFSALSRDYNPVHCDTGYAALKGMKGRIAHGLLTASLVTEIGGQIGWLAKGMNFRFRRPVYAGETLTCTWTMLEIDGRGHGQAEVTVTNGDGIVVLVAETAGVLPNDREREHLAGMLAEGDPTNGVTSPA